MMYDGWAPWNRNAQADSLLPRAAEYFARTLDAELLELHHPRHGRVYAGVDGRQLLAVYREDAANVVAKLTDLSQLSADPLELAK